MWQTVAMSEQASPPALQAFRTALHACFRRRADALFEIVDALLTAGPVPSPAHLSLQGEHRRGWGSLYAALTRGQPDVGSLRRLVGQYPLAEGQPIYALDASVWVRCDAETSPGRGYYYHPSRHSAGKPIVAGWSYQWLSQIGFARDSWTAPLDVQRLYPGEEVNTAAAGMIRRLLRRLPADGPVPLFVFDAGYDSLQLSLDLTGQRAAILVRLRKDRCFYADPQPEELVRLGRPRRHGRKFACADPRTWPTPSPAARRGGRAVWAGDGAGLERAAPAARQSRHQRPVQGEADRAGHAGACGGQPPAGPYPQTAGALAVVGGRGYAGPGRPLARLRPTLRSGTYLPLPQGDPQLDAAARSAIPCRPTAGPGWCWPPTPSCGWRVPWSPTGVCPGNDRSAQGSSRPIACIAPFLHSCRISVRLHNCAETLRALARPAQRCSIRACATLPRHQTHRLRAIPRPFPRIFTPVPPTFRMAPLRVKLNHKLRASSSIRRGHQPVNAPRIDESTLHGRPLFGDVYCRVTIQGDTIQGTGWASYRARSVRWKD